MYPATLPPEQQKKLRMIRRTLAFIHTKQPSKKEIIHPSPDPPGHLGYHHHREVVAVGRFQTLKIARQEMTTTKTDEFLRMLTPQKRQGCEVCQVGDGLLTSWSLVELPQKNGLA